MCSLDQFGSNGATCGTSPLEQEVDDRDLGYAAVQLLFPDACDQTFLCQAEMANGKAKTARCGCNMFAVESSPRMKMALMRKKGAECRRSEQQMEDDTTEILESCELEEMLNLCGTCGGHRRRSSSSSSSSGRKEDELTDHVENGEKRGCEGSLKRPLEMADEYDVLDDLLDEGMNSSGDEKGWGDSEDEADEEDDCHVPEEEIDALLDEKLDEYREMKRARREEENDEMAHEEREKVVLKVRGQDHFEVLPEGWIEVTHNSGMPIYLHKKSRVCTLSKPYFLGPGSARKHEAPIAAIPCLQYRREIEKERQKQLLQTEQIIEPQLQTEQTAEPQLQTEQTAEPQLQTEQTAEPQLQTEQTAGPLLQTEQTAEPRLQTEQTAEPRLQTEQTTEPQLRTCKVNEENSSEIVKINEVTCAETNPVEKGPNMLNAKIETVQENTKEKSIDYLELRNYCQRLFEFKTIKVRRFKTWAGRRKHQKKMKQMHRPTLPLGTKLITCPLPPGTDKEEGPTTNPRRAEFVMNPNGKSYVCILHEYVQHAMRVQPRYLFRELDNSSAPYGASVVINDMEYGFGFGGSKKQAKLDAAKATLEILIPQMKYINPDEKHQGLQQQDLALFDEIRVEDPRVSELCAKAGQPSPYQILLECLKRNYGLGDTQVKFEMQMLKHQKNEFTMTVGKHKVAVVCKNKRDGKQRASQGILQLLHTHINSWGSLLRLYGKGSCKSPKEKKLEEQQITELQCRTTANKPNQSILFKLRVEMLKLKEKSNARKPIGKFVPTDIEPPSSSGSNLSNVDL